jgi:hypothetical protein
VVRYGSSPACSPPSGSADSGSPPPICRRFRSCRFRILRGSIIPGRATVAARASAIPSGALNPVSRTFDLVFAHPRFAPLAGFSKACWRSSRRRLPLAPASRLAGPSTLFSPMPSLHCHDCEGLSGPVSRRGFPPATIGWMPAKKMHDYGPSHIATQALLLERSLWIRSMGSRGEAAAPSGPILACCIKKAKTCPVLFLLL